MSDEDNGEDVVTSEEKIGDEATFESNEAAFEAEADAEGNFGENIGGEEYGNLESEDQDGQHNDQNEGGFDENGGGDAIAGDEVGQESDLNEEPKVDAEEDREASVTDVNDEGVRQDLDIDLPSDSKEAVEVVGEPEVDTADDSAEEAVVRRSAEVVEEPEIDIPIYEVTKLRKPINIADIGREGTALYHVFGNDLSRRGNLHLIADNVLVYVYGNAVVFENIDTKSKDYLIGIDDNGVGCVAVHPSRTKFAVGGKGFQPNIYVYSYPEKQVLNVLRGGAERGYSSIAFNLKGDRLASVAMSPDFMLTVWEWKYERIGLHAKAFGQDVYSVRFSLDDERRLTSCGTGHIRFWKMAATFTGLKLQGSIGKFGKVELSDVAAFVELPDGKVVSGTESGSLLLWEGNFIKARFVREEGRLCHDGEVTYVELDREDRRLATAGKDGYIRWWDFQTVDSAEVDSDHSMDYELTPLAEYFLGVGKGVRSMVDGGIVAGTRSFFILDTSGSTQVVQFPLLAVAKGGDAGEAGEASESKPSESKPRRLSQVIQSLTAGDPDSVPKITVVSQHHCGPIAAIDTSPREHFAASCGKDTTVRLWDYTTRTELYSKSFDARPTALRWVPPHIDPSCRSIMVGFSDGVVRMLKITRDADGNARLKRKMAFKPHTSDVTDLSFSQKNTYLATASTDGIVFFFDCNDNQGVDGSWTPLRFARMNKAKPIDETALTATAFGEKIIVATKVAWCTSNDTVLCTCNDGLLREIDVYDMVQVGGKRFNSQDTRSFEGSFPITEHVIKVSAGIVASGSIASIAPDSSATAGGGGALSQSASSESLSNLAEANSIPVKASYAVYIPGSAEMLIASTSQQGNQGKSYLLKCPPLANPHATLTLQQTLPEELSQGVYNAEGKDALRNPLPTVIVHSWSNAFIAIGNSDGSVTVRSQKHSMVFARFVAHNGVYGGVSDVAISFDDDFVLSVGKDGLLAVHKIRRDLFDSRGVSLAKDIDAGIFIGKTVKDVVVPPTGEPLYMTEVHSDDTLNDWSAFPPEKRPAEDDSSRKREEEMEKLIPESMDIEAGSYSIQDAKLQSEEDQRRIAAENLKEKVRHQIRALQADYEAIKKRNNDLPAEVRLSDKEIEVDSDYFRVLEEEGRLALEEVHKECAYEAEKAQVLRKKLVSRLMEGLIMDEIQLSAFVLGDSEGSKKSALVVRSLRCQGIDPVVEKILGEVYTQLRSEETDEKKVKATENAKNHAQQALTNVQDKIAEKNKNEEDEAMLAGHSKPDGAQNFSAEARRANRRKRQEKLALHSAKKPFENDDDVRDVAAIRIAEKTMGDYKLKVSDEYEIPEEQRVNASKKKRQMALLEESMVAMRLRFNEQFLALRQLKRDIIFAIRRDNQRIREIDTELGQVELSENLWEPPLDPTEYLDDFQEVAHEELEIFRKIRETTPWLKAIPPPHSVIVGDKTVIRMNEITGDYDTRRPDPFAHVDISSAVEFFADPTKMNVLPPRADEPKSYEVRDIVLENLVKKTQSKEEVARILELENVVPALKYARDAMRKRSPVIAQSAAVASAASGNGATGTSGTETATGGNVLAAAPSGKFKLSAANFVDKKMQTAEQLRAWEERSRRLRIEREKLVEKTKTNVVTFEEALEHLRVERHCVTADLKLAEMKLLAMFQEYVLLQTFESKDISLQQRQVRCEKEKSEITQSTNESKTKLDHKVDELKSWSDKALAVHADLKSHLPDSHPFADILTKIFRKKIKRSKANGGNENEDDEEEDDDDDDDDEDEEVDDACPPGCDRILHEKVLELREKRADIDDVVSDIQKSIDEMKKAMDRLKQREKQIAKDAAQAEVEVRQFQLQKQAALNQIQISVPLSISQIYAFEASGRLTGPTDKHTSGGATVTGETTAAGAPAAGDADAATVGSQQQQQKEVSLLQDVSELARIEERRLVPEISMTSHVLFSRPAMLQLHSRIGELHEEIDEASVNFKELHKERVRLNKEREIRRAEIESWEKRCNDLQMLKFGRLVDLDELEEGSDRTKEHEAEAIVKKVEDRGRLVEYKLRQEMETLEEELAQLTIKNTELLNVVANLSESKLNITRELNDSKSGPAVSHDTKQADKSSSEERQRLKAYVDIQAREIAALQAEITMLKRKDIPPLPSLMSQSQPVGAVGFGTEDLRSQSARSPSGLLAGETIQPGGGESYAAGILPPIPGVTRSKSQGSSSLLKL